jgi:hypothetical protein
MPSHQLLDPIGIHRTIRGQLEVSRRRGEVVILEETTVGGRCHARWDINGDSIQSRGRGGAKRSAENGFFTRTLRQRQAAPFPQRLAAELMTKHVNSTLRMTGKIEPAIEMLHGNGAAEVVPRSGGQTAIEL